MAILRFKREDNAKAAYNEAFRASHTTLNEMRKGELKNQDLPQVATKVVALLAVAAEKPGTTHLLMSLESLCWGLLDFVKLGQMPELWKKIVQAGDRCRAISLRKWQTIVEFLCQHLGMFIFDEARVPQFSGVAVRPNAHA